MVTYCVHSGSLFTVENDRPAVRLDVVKGSLFDSKKTILTPDGTVELVTEIQAKDHGARLQDRRYIMMDQSGQTLAVGLPAYEKSADPEVMGWPIYRSPHVDHATIRLGGRELCLYMLNSQNYRLVDTQDKPVFELIHNGLRGGWNIETEKNLEPRLLLGLFVFCRYLEQENEFITV